MAAGDNGASQSDPRLLKGTVCFDMKVARVKVNLIKGHLSAKEC